MLRGSNNLENMLTSLVTWWPPCLKEVRQATFGFCVLMFFFFSDCIIESQSLPTYKKVQQVRIGNYVYSSYSHIPSIFAPRVSHMEMVKWDVKYPNVGVPDTKQRICGFTWNNSVQGKISECTGRHLLCSIKRITTQPLPKLAGIYTYSI